MNSSSDHDLQAMVEQLEEAWSQWCARGESFNAFEVAAISGLLDRAGVCTPEMLMAGCQLSVLRERVVDEMECKIAEAFAFLADLDEADPQEVADQVLFNFDEIGAAAMFLGLTERVAVTMSIATRTIRAFPEPFVKSSELAAKLLVQRTPKKDDPALSVWQAAAESFASQMQMAGLLVSVTNKKFVD